MCRQDPALLARLAGRHREEIDRARNGTPVSWAGHSAHQPLFLAAAELVSLAAAERGLLLTIDDVHDADDGSLRLLHYLARSARGQRVCIVLAHRPVPVASALEATRRSLIERYGAAELRLGPLGDRDTAALIRRYVAEPPAELVKLVTTLGRGVPFLVTELARRAVAQLPAPGPARRRAGLGAGPPGQHVRPAAAGHPRGPPAGGRGRRVVRYRRIRRPVRGGRTGGLRPPRRRPRRRGSSSP